MSTNMAGRGTDILLGGNPEGMSAELIEREMFKRPLLTQLIFTYLEKGEDAAHEQIRRNSKLDDDLLPWITAEKARMDAALVEIEELQVMGYLTRILGEQYQLEYDQIRQVIRFVSSNNLLKAREYLEQLNKDVALVEETLRLRDMYVNYQRAQGDNGLLAQFLAEILFEQHYNARAALIRAILNGDEAEAANVVQTVPGIAKNWIDKIKDVQEGTKVEREEVWQLGGLHVVGSERHESRRIDNQLRGRAARQGDPGSSRFFLSLEDELMRRFGGERLKSWMSKGVLSSIPEDMPLEFGVLDRMIASAQERVEGYNFDMRKNIVEYDDVMSRQRVTVYNERRAILMGESVDYDDKIGEAFANAIAQLVDNYVENYVPFVREEVQRVVADFTTEATDAININAVVARLRGLLPDIIKIDKAELAQLSNDKLIDRLMVLVYENEENGANIYQLLQAMGRFLPLLPPIPNLGGLASRKSGQVQAKRNVQRDYVANVHNFYDEFVTDHVELPADERDEIWLESEEQLNQAFSHFSLDGLSLKTADFRQTRFAAQANAALRNLLLDTLSALDGAQLEIALKAYVSKQQDKWRKQIGEEEYRNFQRLLLLDSTDREWRDYLTAADDLRREIGLEAIGQRDPKVQYKIRSAQMFNNMRDNIEQNIVERFFFQVDRHRQFIQKQEAEIAYQTQAQDAGFQVVKRKKGRGVELRRDMPKVGRNDLCPCGSGKKYKHCHLKQDLAGAKSSGTNGQAKRPFGSPKRSGKKRRRRR
ncbi:Protein translocase subunit SecA [hydrothermal vent metagenome]|uniref:Protein translocase subunit SecA n=1 Tax=hydrothermal vent metagenome TaxID=652676 RepID=A0A3B0UV16_9ZZZZ